MEVIILIWLENKSFEGKIKKIIPEMNPLSFFHN